MKISRASLSILGLPALIFFYLLTAVLSTSFSSKIFSSFLFGSGIQSPVVIAVFISVPVAVSIFMVFYTIRLLPGLSRKNAGGRLEAGFFLFFILTVLTRFIAINNY